MSEAVNISVQPKSDRRKGRLALLVGYTAAVVVAMAGWLYFLVSIAWDFIGWLAT